jgi:hypothetical protein
MVVDGGGGNVVTVEAVGEGVDADDIDRELARDRAAAGTTDREASTDGAGADRDGVSGGSAASEAETAAETESDRA